MGILWGDEEQQAGWGNSDESSDTHGIGNDPENPSTRHLTKIAPQGSPDPDRFVRGTPRHAANCRRAIRTIRRKIHESTFFSIGCRYSWKTLRCRSTCFLLCRGSLANTTMESKFTTQPAKWIGMRCEFVDPAVVNSSAFGHGLSFGEFGATAVHPSCDRPGQRAEPDP